MKTALLIASIFLVSAISHSAFACPNLSGTYSAGKINVFEEEVVYEIKQTGCEELRLAKTVKQIGKAPSSTSSEIKIDGLRHADNSGIYWMSTWIGDRLVQEPWSAQTEGELLGDRSYWFLNQDSLGATFLINQIVDDEETILFEKVLQKQ